MGWRGGSGAFSESSAVVAGEGEGAFRDGAVGGQEAYRRRPMCGAAEPDAGRARGAGELELVGEIECQEAGGAAEKAGEGGAGLGGGAGEDGLGARLVKEMGELAGMGADVVVCHVAEPAGAAGEVGGGRGRGRACGTHGGCAGAGAARCLQSGGAEERRCGRGCGRGGRGPGGYAP